MAVAVNTTSSGTTSSITGDVAVTKPTGITAADLLLAIVYNDSAVLATVPTGWSQVGSYQTRAGAGTQSVWSKVATGSEPTTYTWGSGNSNDSALVVVFDITGTDPVSPSVSPITAQGGTATTAQTAPSVTPTQANSLLICSFDELNGTFTYSVPTGMTSVTGGTSTINDAFANLAVFYKQLASTSATGSTSSTASSSQVYNSFSMVVEPPAPIPHIAPTPPNRARICSSNFL